ncbi:MAG: corrinoid protein [Desulfobacterales bacterium]|jgi:5-methyltetrahydrofolate--homocysteine methyltransferase
MSEVLTSISTAVIEGKKDDIAKLTQTALDEGQSAQDILYQGLMPGMDHVSVKFKAGDMFVPEVMRSARTMANAMEVLKPLLVETGVKMIGKVLIGTVKGDLHDIGKNLVGMMCEGAGFEVKDLGISVEPEAFVEAVKDFEPEIVGMSALLTTTMRAMGDTIKAFEEAGVRDRVKVMVGGAPVNQSFADKIGADAYAPDAAAASDVAKKFVKKD